MYQVLNVLILMKIDYKIKSCAQTDMCKYYCFISRLDYITVNELE